MKFRNLGFVQHLVLDPENAGFLIAIPTEQSFSMSNVQMVTAVRLRLGLPVIPAIETTQVCSCGNSLDLLENHLILCKRGAEVSQRHNMLVQAWSRLIKKNNFSCIPRH